MSDEIETTGGEISVDSPSWLGYATSWLTENGWDGRDGVETFGQTLPLDIAEMHVSEAKTILHGRPEEFIPRGNGVFLRIPPIMPSRDRAACAVARIVVARIQHAKTTCEIDPDMFPFVDDVDVRSEDSRDQ